MRSRPNAALYATEATFACSLLLVLLTTRDLPLVDLPQHALQLSRWVRLDAGDPGVAEFELNFRTPYLLAYPLARALAAVLPILTALKLTFWTALTLQAVTLRKLCERLGHDPWLGLLGFPLGLGYSFCFGFVAFCGALPVAYLAFLFAAVHREKPSLVSGGKLALALGLLLVAHGVALGFLLVVLGPLLLWGGGKLWQRLWPLLSPPLLGAVWLLPATGTSRMSGDVWRLEPERLLEIPGQLVTIGAADHLGSLLGVALLAVLFASVGRPRSWLLAFPLLASLLGYALFPTMFHGAGPLGPRFSSFFVPAVLVGFQPGRAVRIEGVRVRRACSLAVAAAVLGLFAFRLRDFNRELDDFHALIAPLPAGLQIRPLVFERGSRAFPGIPSHLHVPAYYALEKGGDPGYSFAMYPISVVRLRPGARVKMGGGAEWSPESFDPEREARNYDYFIVKSSVDRGSALDTPDARIVLEQRVGDWWAYRRNGPRADAVATSAAR